MKYILVEWKHDNPDEPVLLYSELDEARWEQRKVEIHRNGRQGFADGSNEFGGSRLGLEPVPDLSEIAADPEFAPREIPKETFEAVWLRRHARLDMK